MDNTPWLTGLTKLQKKQDKPKDRETKEQRKPTEVLKVTFFISCFCIYNFISKYITVSFNKF